MLREGQISSRPLSAVGDSARIICDFHQLLYSPHNHALFNARLLHSFLIMRRNFAESRNQPFQQHGKCLKKRQYSELYSWLGDCVCLADYTMLVASSGAADCRI
jgi:hypothetical protein